MSLITNGSLNNAYLFNDKEITLKKISEMLFSVFFNWSIQMINVFGYTIFKPLTTNVFIGILRRNYEILQVFFFYFLKIFVMSRFKLSIIKQTKNINKSKTNKKEGQTKQTCLSLIKIFFKLKLFKLY